MGGCVYHALLGHHHRLMSCSCSCYDWAVQTLLSTTRSSKLSCGRLGVGGRGGRRTHRGASTLEQRRRESEREEEMDVLCCWLVARCLRGLEETTPLGWAANWHSCAATGSFWMVTGAVHVHEVSWIWMGWRAVIAFDRTCVSDLRIRSISGAYGFTSKQQTSTINWHFLSPSHGCRTKKQMPLIHQSL